MTKTLTGLSMVQTVLLLVLTVKLVYTGEGQAAATAPQLPAASVTAKSDEVTSIRDRGLDEERLRQIVREELAAHSSRSSRQDPATAPDARPSDATGDPSQREHVEQQIDYYVGLGQISDNDMQRLQAGIVKLDIGARRQMMSKLVRALNSGELKGRLQ